MGKKSGKVSISLKSEDEALLLRIRAHYEAKHGRMFTLAAVVRQMALEVSQSNAA